MLSLIDLAAECIAAGTVITVAAMRLARKMSEPRSSAFDRERKILEREQRAWMNTATDPTVTSGERKTAAQLMLDVDKKLIELAHREDAALKPKGVEDE
jgi:hypothetical protein